MLAHNQIFLPLPVHNGFQGSKRLCNELSLERLLITELLIISANNAIACKYLDFISHNHFKDDILDFRLSIITALVHNLQHSLAFGDRRVLAKLFVNLLCEILIAFRMQLRRESLLIDRVFREVNHICLLFPRLIHSLK